MWATEELAAIPSHCHSQSGSYWKPEGRSSCKCYPQGTNQASGQSQSRQSSFFIRARLTCVCVVTQTNLLRRGAWARTGVGTLSCCPKDKMHLQAVRNPGIASPPRMYSGLVEGRQPFKAIKTTQPTELRGAEARPFASAPPCPHSVKARLLNVASGALLQQTRGHRGRYAVSPLSVRT